MEKKCYVQMTLRNWVLDAYSVFMLTERELKAADAHGVNAGGKGIRWA